MKKASISGYFILLVMLVFRFSIPGWMWQAHAAPLPQPTAFKTPTPGPDGRIFYIVQDQDTLWSISAITGMSLDELRAINSLHPNESIRPGQQIYLGMGGPAAVTPTSGPTQPLPTPTISPTPEIGTAILCVLLFEDINGDSLRQEEEPAIPKGAIHVGEQTGKFTKSEDTITGFDPNCYEDLPPGQYTISVAVPEEYNPTTDTNYQIELNPGDETYVDFGAQNKSTGSSGQTSAPAADSKPSVVVSSTTPILGILGGVSVLVGIALFIFAIKIKR